MKLGFKTRQEAQKEQRALAGCLQSVLGAGTETVVDYVRGTRSFDWKLGEHGDTIVLGLGELSLSAAEKSPIDRAAAWEARFPTIVSSVNRCRL